MTNKLYDAQGCIVDAEHLVNLMEIAADAIVEGEAEGPGAPHAPAISCAGRIVREKLGEAARLLNEAEREARETAKPEAA